MLPIHHSSMAGIHIVNQGISAMLEGDGQDMCAQMIFHVRNLSSNVKAIDNMTLSILDDLLSTFLDSRTGSRPDCCITIHAYEYYEPGTT